MASTYTVNLGIEKIGTGEQSGTWGTTTNTNFDLIDEAVNGVITVTLSSAGSSGSPNSLVVTNGASSNGRNKFIEFADGGDLGGTAFVQLTPNDAEKIVHVRNSLSGSRSVIIFQGTYNASNDFEIPNGKDVVLKFNGGGSGATVTDVFADLQPTALTTATLTATTADINGGTIDGATIGGASAAAGSFTTLTASDDVNFDSGTLFVDASANRVGIGTTSPSVTLDVAGEISFGASANKFTSSTNVIEGIGTNGVRLRAALSAAATPSFSNSDDTDTGMFLPGSDVIGFTTGGSERARIDSSGNFGIGTTSPSNNLHIASAAAAIRLEDTDNNTYGQIVYNTSAGGLFIRSDEGAGTGTSGSNIIFETDGTERARIDASGDVGIGTNSPLSTLDTRASTGGVLTLSTSDTAIQSATSDILGKIQFQAPSESSGTQAIKPAASISAVCEATNFNSSRNDTGLVFATNSTSANPVEGMRLDHDRNFLVGTSVAHVTTSTFSGLTQLASGVSIQKRDSGVVAHFDRLTDDGDILQFRRDGTTVGSIGSSSGELVIDGNNVVLSENGTQKLSLGATALFPITDNSYDLGTSSKRYDDIFATNGTIQTSDANEKQDIAELDEAERRVAVAAKGLLRKFRWKDSVAEKGDDARIHFGIIAQDLQAAFEAQGLDAGRYAMFIHSTWTDEETGEERSRMGVRYSELLAFIIAAL